jgi:hypothetical protein
MREGGGGDFLDEDLPEVEVTVLQVALNSN